MVIANPYHTHGNVEASARLIAAAPELLEACKALLDEHSDCKGCESSAFAMDIIAKAEGR